MFFYRTYFVHTWALIASAQRICVAKCKILPSWIDYFVTIIYFFTFRRFRTVCAFVYVMNALLLFSAACLHFMKKIRKYGWTYSFLIYRLFYRSYVFDFNKACPLHLTHSLPTFHARSSRIESKQLENRLRYTHTDIQSNDWAWKKVEEERYIDAKSNGKNIKKKVNVCNAGCGCLFEKMKRRRGIKAEKSSNSQTKTKWRIRHFRVWKICFQCAYAF